MEETTKPLTVCKPWRAVVHIGEGDADRGGPGKPPHLSCHVFGLDHHLVVFLDLPVHAGQRRLNGT